MDACGSHDRRIRSQDQRAKQKRSNQAAGSSNNRGSGPGASNSNRPDTSRNPRASGQNAPDQPPSGSLGTSGTLGQLQNDAGSRERGDQLEQNRNRGAGARCSARFRCWPPPSVTQLKLDSHLSPAAHLNACGRSWCRYSDSTVRHLLRTHAIPNRALEGKTSLRSEPKPLEMFVASE